MLTNRAIQQFAARRGAAFAGMSATNLLTQNEHEQIQSVDHQVLATRRPMVLEQEFANDDESERRSFSLSVSPYWQAGQVRGVMGYVQEITERKRQEAALAELNRTLEANVLERTRDLQLLNEQLRHANMHDSLTQLPNRAQLKARLQALIDGQGHSGICAMLFIDLDKFKSVNDNLGHAAGDELLLQVGERLRQMQSAADMVARLGGDEFVMLLEALPSREAALELAEKVESLFLRPFEVAGRELLMSASIGLTIFDDAGGSAEEFLQQADMAMYRAKTRQGGHYELFSPEIRERRQMLVGLQQDIKHALRRGELFVQYQPVVTLPNELIAGFEALVRWQHPVHGLISPAEFIPVAEDAGVIHDIDLWVLRQACRATHEYVQSGQLYKLSVNLSTKNFLFADLVSKLRHILKEERFPSESLIIEVTESILVEDFQTVSTMTWELRAMGILIAADDFGTGYSSLSYLHRLPFTSVKLDRSFVSSLEYAPAILRSVLELAGQLGLSVVAEGVERHVRRRCWPKCAAPLHRVTILKSR